MGRRVILPLGAAVMTVLGGAAASGYLAANAAAQVFRRDDSDDSLTPLLLIPPDSSRVLIAGHSSHRSHSSHYSSSGGRGRRSSGRSSSGGGAPVYSESTEPTVKPVAPPPVRKAHVSLVAFPGGAIYLDGKAVGRDATKTLTLKPGTYSIRIVNRFIGEHTATILVTDGETGVIPIKW